MARRIHILPDQVANQIAAGEVVERPASVVKELVENALDAGATTVRVEIEGGGKRRIRVSDDGVGMGREDALLSLDRHATSKIATAEELARVASFGFRGEALPSIAAVSRMVMETRESGEPVGTSVRVEGGRILSVDDVARRPGTTVEVRNLFFNAPARRKFLRSVGVEARAVGDAVISLALAHPSVAFRLLSGARTLLDLPPAENALARIGDLWGREAASSLLEAGGEGEGMSVRGLLQRPDAARPGYRRAYLFVNGRPFRDSALLKAADRGYRTTIAQGQRPWVFLYLQAADGTVDVNVHPAKAEVRFRDSQAVSLLVEETVRNALAGLESSAPLYQHMGGDSLVLREEAFRRRGPGSGPSAKVLGDGSHSDQMALFVPLEPGEGGAPGERQGAEAGSALEESAGGPAGLPLGEASTRLWQLHATWILVETREALLIIDQHSAHERVLFHRLMERFSRGGEEGQRLLFPLTFRLSAGEVQVVEELGGILGKAGFEVESFGGDTVILHAVPHPHPYFDPERCFREMVRDLSEGSELVRSARNQHERIAMTFACKGAIKAGQRLNPSEMEQLVEDLFSTELPFHDVHGRPTVVRLSRSELERRFGRHG